MADRVGVIDKGEIVLVEDKAALMGKLGKKQLTLELRQPIPSIPPPLASYGLDLSEDGKRLTYTFAGANEQTSIASLLRQLIELGVDFYDLQTRESSLEEIFVSLVGGDPTGAGSAAAPRDKPEPRP
jgi:ABC-2 type transport system ATP-binding protein